jgi:hypothetical protein
MSFWNPHDKFGRIDLAMLTPEKVAEAGLNDEQAAVIAIVSEAVTAREAGAVRKKLAEDATRAAMRIEADCYEIHVKANPPQTALEAQRASFANYAGNAPATNKKPASHPKHAIAGPRVAYEKAMAVLQDCRIELENAKNDFRRLEIAEGAALAEMIKTLRPPSALDVHRANIEREQAQKYANVEAGLNADGSAKVATVGDNSPISAVFAARRKSGFSRRRVVHKPVHPPLFKV